jgi:hypothetical protein
MTINRIPLIPGRFLRAEVSNTFRSTQIIADWLSANGHTPVRQINGDRYGCVVTAEGVTVYRNGYIGRVEKDVVL